MSRAVARLGALGSAGASVARHRAQVHDHGSGKFRSRISGGLTRCSQEAIGLASPSSVERVHGLTLFEDAVNPSRVPVPDPGNLNAISKGGVFAVQALPDLDVAL